MNKLIFNLFSQTPSPPKNDLSCLCFPWVTTTMTRTSHIQIFCIFLSKVKDPTSQKMVS